MFYPQVTCNEFWKKFEEEKAEERAARAAVTTKRQQIDSLQLTINKLKNVHSIEELDSKVRVSGDLGRVFRLLIFFLFIFSYMFSWSDSNHGI